MCVLSTLVRAAAKARGSNLRVHFKHMREVAHLIKGMKLSKAKVYLQVGHLTTRMFRIYVGTKFLVEQFH